MKTQARLFALCAAGILALPAAAQTTTFSSFIAASPSVSVLPGGSDYLPVVQSGLTKKMTGLNFALSRITAGTLTPDANLPGGFAASAITSVSDNAALTPMAVWSYGATTAIGFEFYRARGTAASPTAIQSGDTLIDMGGRGYDGTQFESSNVAIVSSAAENWTNVARGTWITLSTTSTGGTARTSTAELSPAGNWTAKAFIGAGMVPLLPGAHNQQPVTYFHAIGLAQPNYGLLALQDSFHAGSASVSYMSFFDDSADGSGTGRLGWFGFNASSAMQAINLVGDTVLSGNGGPFVYAGVNGLGVGEVSPTGSKFATTGNLRVDSDSGLLNFINTTGPANVLSIGTRKGWGDGSGVTDAAIGAQTNLYFYAGASTTAAYFIDTGRLLNLGTAANVANSTATVAGTAALGPTGTACVISSWEKKKDSSGNTRYQPLFSCS